MALNVFLYKSIKYFYILFLPDIILIEEVPFDKSISPELSYFQGEGKYASDLAIKYNIPFSGIEGDEDKILLLLSKNIKYKIFMDIFI